MALDRNDVALRAGRHGELLVELTAALAAHPLDERLAGQLMLAQYRSGRQADALDTYRQMRQRLVEELGVDPGPALRQVHQQILAGDPEDPVRGSGDRRRVRRCRGRWFSIGRFGPVAAGDQLRRPHQELAQVIDALREGPLVTLTGVGGVGKTRLAVEVARRERALR